MSRHLKDKMEMHLNLACGMVRDLDEQVDDLKQQMKPKLTWKFDKFIQHRNVAKNGWRQCHTSPPLGTGPQGYQLQTVIDQQADPEERENVQRTMVSAESMHVSSFVRPSAAQPNPSLGFVNFVSQNTLNTRGYLVDDALFFQLEVDLLNSVE